MAFLVLPIGSHVFAFNTVGENYNSDGTLTIQAYLDGDLETDVPIFSSYEVPFTLIKSRIQLDILSDVQTGFAVIRCGVLGGSWAFGNYFSVILDRRDGEGDFIESDFPFTCPVGASIFVDNQFVDGEGGYDNAYFTIQISTSTTLEQVDYYDFAYWFMWLIFLSSFIPLGLLFNVFRQKT